MFRKILLTTALLFVTLLAACDGSPVLREAVGDTVSERSMIFSDGEFHIFRAGLGGGVFDYSLPIDGEIVSIKYQDYSASAWATADADRLPDATLFIETGRASYIIGVPTRMRDTGYNTVEVVGDNAPRVIANGKLSLTLDGEGGTYGEFWYYRGPAGATEFGDADAALWLRQNLHDTRRFCYDGYYFGTYTTYEPYTPTGMYRNSANFSGAQILTTSTSARDLGYAMTEICRLNQNDDGYWPTGARSTWLYNDYGVSFGFYDTRFSTDFARSLLNANALYGDDDMLQSAVRYADFLVGYVAAQGYDLGGGAVLVPDYYSEGMHTKTHVSLNHHLAELNFLLEIFAVTDNKEYRDTALKMLAGIEATADEWILDDGNLKYALMYDTTSNTMTDYPFLTYNDLHNTRELLAVQGIDSAAINRLMDSKLGWMTENGVTGFKE